MLTKKNIATYHLSCNLKNINPTAPTQTTLHIHTVEHLSPLCSLILLPQYSTLPLALDTWC